MIYKLLTDNRITSKHIFNLKDDFKVYFHSCLPDENRIIFQPDEMSYILRVVLISIFVY